VHPLLLWLRLHWRVEVEAPIYVWLLLTAAAVVGLVTVGVLIARL
jgi:hypothetical protein